MTESEEHHCPACNKIMTEVEKGLYWACECGGEFWLPGSQRAKTGITFLQAERNKRLNAPIDE